MKTGIAAAFVALGLLASAPAPAAGPEPRAEPEKTDTARTDGRFYGMDTDKNGKLSFEEFHANTPQMPRAAFEAIDLDKNDSISLEEWRAFSKGHGMGGHGKPGQMPPPGHGSGRSGPGKQPLVMPPAGK